MQPDEHAFKQRNGADSLAGLWRNMFVTIAAAWSLFQLWIASPLPFWANFAILSGMPARGIHLAFALTLCFLAFHGRSTCSPSRLRPAGFDIFLGLIGAFCASYVMWNYNGLAERAGIMLRTDFGGFSFPTELIISLVGIGVLLEAARRSVGLALVVVCLVFLAYSLMGQSMPDLISHKGVSLERLANSQWLQQEAVFGIPLDVSTRFVFLFVLFGALLDRAGAGKYFIDLSFGLVGRYRGGPAKAAVLASGMTGMISGSSIANTVTTGTFTIPVMKKSGFPAIKAGAIEVSASVNGQIMPPIMGAAAFVIAEYIGISYFDVVKHAFIPAVISYIALFYITDLEAQRLGLTGWEPEFIPRVRDVFWSGAYYFLPIVLLVHLLIWERLTAGTSVFWAIIALMVVILMRTALGAKHAGDGSLKGVANGLAVIFEGLVLGARNMIGVAIAVAAAGVIVGSVSVTGLSNALSGVVEAVAGDNIYLLLVLVAVLCLVLGMGLPTTANYIVVASIMAPVIVEVGGAQGLVLPLIAVHLFVFYFGLMADVTPPVGLASYAAAAISHADPIATGIQAFIYSIRTAILPFIFIFNLDLLLIGLAGGWLGWLQAGAIFCVCLLAMIAFTSLTFRWMLTRLNLVEMALLVFVCLALFRPGLVMDRFFPPFETVPSQAMAPGVDASLLRLHVRRDTAYGVRRRLIVIDRETVAGLPKGPLGWMSLGVTVKPSTGSAVEVTDPGFMTVGEKAGLRGGDFITQIDRPSADRPPKQLIFLPAFLAFAFVFLWQRRRLRAEEKLVLEEFEA